MKSCLSPRSASRLGFLIAYASRVEREFWQLLEVGWAWVGSGSAESLASWPMECACQSGALHTS